MIGWVEGCSVFEGGGCRGDGFFGDVRVVCGDFC